MIHLAMTRSVWLLLPTAALLGGCDDVKVLIFGQQPIEERPAVLAAETAAPAPIAPDPGSEPDPRLTIKLPGGGEASFEYAEAKRLMSRGQYTAASFTLMGKALGDSGTPDELALLGELCAKRNDAECTSQVALKRSSLKDLGPLSLADLKKMARKSPENVKLLLMPRLEDGTLAKEEAAVLADVCKRLRDKECESLAKAAAKPPKK